MADLPRQLPLELGHRPALGREDFLVAPSNEAAVAWLDAWPDWPGGGLAVFGPAGCGKTHLAHVWRARSHAAMLEPGRFAENAPPVLIGEGRAVVLDGVGPPLAPHAERHLLHLHNLLRERDGHLLICARTAPSRWPVTLRDLASRLAALPAVAVTPPDEALIEAVLVKQFADRQLAVAPEIIAFIVGRIERSFAAVAEIVAALDRASLAARRRVTLALARDVLEARRADGVERD